MFELEVDINLYDLQYKYVVLRYFNYQWKLIKFKWKLIYYKFLRDKNLYRCICGINKFGEMAIKTNKAIETNGQMQQKSIIQN